MLSELSKKFPDLREKILRPFLFDIDPNIITFFAFISAIFAGYFYFEGYIYYATFLVFLNGFLDVLDGEIAKKFGRAGKLGDLMDHTFDRLSDIVIFLGLTYSIFISQSLGYLTIITVLMVSYMGTQAHALTNRRLYSGLIGRSDRLLILILGGIATLCYPLAVSYAILLILVLSIITFFQRLWESWKRIG